MTEVAPCSRKLLVGLLVTSRPDLLHPVKARAVRAPGSAHADIAQAEGAIERQGPIVAPQSIKAFARTARKRMRTESGGYAAITFARLPNALKSTSKNVVLWGRKASCCARLSLLQAQKRRVLACPVLYRSGAPDTIRTCDLCLRRATLYPAELRVRCGSFSRLA
jgi:hypothetical protein